MASTKLDGYIRRWAELSRVKQDWLPLYQALAEVFLTRKADFTNVQTPGAFLQDNVFDNTPQFAAYTFASVLLSMLWPDASRSFNLVPVRELEKFPGVEEFFRRVSAKMHRAMDRPEAGLTTALGEYLLDQGIFGISGVGTFEGPKDDPATPVVFQAWDVKAMCVSQNAQGYVDTVFFEVRMTVRQVYEEYSILPKRVSPDLKEKYDAGKKEDFVEVLKVIEPRIGRDLEKRGVQAMRFKTCHIDLTHKTIMWESGYEEMPVAVGRMFKRIDETYARSPGMVALPDANSLNALSEDILVASEKNLAPPLVVMDDGRLGGGVIDQSAKAVNVFNTVGRLGMEKPIYPLTTVGEMQSAKELMEFLTGKLMQAFYLDRLLDLNNKTPMTAYETSIRSRLRGESLGSLFSRQISEVVSPTIKRTFNVMFRAGHFGIVEKGVGAQLRKLWYKVTGQYDLIVPDVVLKAYAAGLDVYEVEYISPAHRFMQAEKLQGAFTGSDAISALEAVMPGIVDNLDKDVLARRIWEFSGGPRDAVRTMDDLKKFREEMAQRQNAAMALEAGDKMASIQQKTAAAQASRAQMFGGS